MRKIDFEKPHIKQLNRELEYERKGKMIFKTISAMIITFLVIGPTVLLVLLNADWIDAHSNRWQVQLGYFVLFIISTSCLYIRWKLNK